MKSRFNVTSKRLACSDPCYESPEVEVRAKNGTWAARALVSKDRSWGRRIGRLEAKHLDYDKTRPCEVKVYRPGVDSGQFGVFDGGMYHAGDDEDFYGLCCDATLGKDQCGGVRGGFVSSSGFGDGVYECEVSSVDGEAVKVVVTFIEGETE